MKFLQLPYNFLKVLHTDIYYGIPWIFAPLWPWFGLENQRCNQPLSWYSQIIFWLWRCDSHLFKTDKLQRFVQGGVLFTTLYLYVFPNIATTTIFHVHSCELTRCKIFFPCELSSQNIFGLDKPLWIDSGITTARSFMFIITYI